MRRTIIYYPNIDIPDSKWLRNSLLYWDEVSSIVPRSIETDLYTNSHLIAQLRDEGEYRAIFPDQLMQSDVFNDFENEVINKLSWNNRARFKRYRNINEFGSIARTREPRSLVHNEKVFNNFDIHREKISNRIFEKLEQSGMVSWNGDWMSFDDQSANIYMATLAKFSALSDANYTVIGTDKPNLINSVYPVSYLYRKPVKYTTPIVNLSLNILPTPTNDVPIEKIIKFKKKYREELLAFRNQINQFEVYQ
jgi:hypothetical protein